MALSNNPLTMSASTLGTRRRWIGSMPITRIASISSRMVRDPSSAHIAVAPQPATTNTVDIGPMYTTHANAAPGPGGTAAPLASSKMLMMTTEKGLNGIETINVGKIVTRATNQL